MSTAVRGNPVYEEPECKERKRLLEGKDLRILQYTTQIITMNKKILNTLGNWNNFNHTRALSLSCKQKHG